MPLRVFVRIADARSFAKAADTLDLPRSSDSKLLQDLAQHLGTKLVERSTRALTITPEGEAYRDLALGLLADGAALHHGLIRQDGVFGSMSLGRQRP